VTDDNGVTATPLAPGPACEREKRGERERTATGRRWPSRRQSRVGAPGLPELGSPVALALGDGGGWVYGV
jgi:hypothetical protein